MVIKALKKIGKTIGKFHPSVILGKKVSQGISVSKKLQGEGKLVSGVTPLGSVGTSGAGLIGRGSNTRVLPAVGRSIAGGSGRIVGGISRGVGSVGKGLAKTTTTSFIQNPWRTTVGLASMPVVAGATLVPEFRKTVFDYVKGGVGTGMAIGKFIGNDPLGKIKNWLGGAASNVNPFSGGDSWSDHPIVTSILGLGALGTAGAIALPKIRESLSGSTLPLTTPQLDKELPLGAVPEPPPVEEKPKEKAQPPTKITVSPKFENIIQIQNL